MNIFKILSSGDGNIKEPSVSAFLGYLLDPKADHGLGDELLKRIIYQLYQVQPKGISGELFDQENEIRSLSSNSNLDVIVLLEQAFTLKKTDDDEPRDDVRLEAKSEKSIVDIVVLIFEKTKQKTNSKENLVDIELASDSEKRSKLLQMLLIEIKIRDGASSKEEQLIKYVEGAKKLLDKTRALNNTKEAKPYLLFIAPNEPRSTNLFSAFSNKTNEFGFHMYWHDLSNQTDSTGSDRPLFVTDILRNILVDESMGDIEAINEYTKHTIKSFISFINNGFASSIQEKIRKSIEFHIFDSIEELRQKFKDSYTDNQWKILLELDKRIRSIQRNNTNLVIRHSRTHAISVFIKENDKNVKIFQCDNYSTRNNDQMRISAMGIRYSSVRNKVEDFMMQKGIEELRSRKEGRSVDIIFREPEANLIFDLFQYHYDLVSK